MRRSFYNPEQEREKMLSRAVVKKNLITDVGHGTVCGRLESPEMCFSCQHRNICGR